GHPVIARESGRPARSLVEIQDAPLSRGMTLGLLAPLQIQQAAGLEVELDVIGIDLAQGEGRVAVADLPGRKLVDDLELRRPLRSPRPVPKRRHTAFAVGAGIAVEADDTLAGAVDCAL